MKKVRALALIAAAIVVGWVGRGWRDHRGHGADSSHTGPTIEQVQMLSSLVTMKVDVADVVETRLSGYTGGVRAVVIVKGDLLLGVNLSAARFESVDAVRRRAVLLLPQPQIQSPRLDHERTRLFAVAESGLWQITPGGAATDVKVTNTAYRDAQRYVVEVSGDPSLAARARRQAETVLITFFGAMGWQVEIRWDGS